MKHKLILLLAIAMALAFVPMTFATAPTPQMVKWVPFSETAVQADLTALMVPEAPDIGVAIVNANKTSVFSQVDLDSRSKTGSSLVSMVSPPTLQAIYSSTIMLRSMVLNDKQPMLAAQQQVSMVNHIYANTGIDIKMVGAYAALPNTANANILGETAFSRSLIGSNVISATKMENNEVAIVVIGKIEVGKMVKESISSSCGTAYGTIIST